MAAQIRIKNVLHEPLLHFLVLGVLIFIAYGLLPNSSNTDSEQIIITKGELESIRATFITTWQRPPTKEEFDGLVSDRVREEVYYREALAIGLDKDDIIIRRRLRQKMEFIGNDIATQTEPSEEDLSNFLIQHPELFSIEPHLSFRQVYLNPERRANTLKGDVSSLLSQLNQADTKTNFQKLGDATLLSAEMADVRATEVTNQFGADFTKQLTQLPIHRWVGPVTSTYGVHVVYIGERTDSKKPLLSDVHDAVRREWENARLLEENEKLYKEMLKRYVVTIEQPQSTLE